MGLSSIVAQCQPIISILSRNHCYHGATVISYCSPHGWGYDIREDESFFTRPQEPCWPEGCDLNQGTWWCRSFVKDTAQGVTLASLWAIALSLKARLGVIVSTPVGWEGWGESPHSCGYLVLLFAVSVNTVIRWVTWFKRVNVNAFTHVAICNRRDMGPMLDTSARCRVPMSGRQWNDNAGRCRGEFASKMSVRYRWSISSRYHGDVFFCQKINNFELFPLITDV